MTNITLSALKQGSAEITVTSTADPTVTARIPAVISPADQATPVKLTDGMWSLPGDGGDGFLNAADKIREWVNTLSGPRIDGEIPAWSE